MAMANKNSYLVIIPKLLKVGYDNQISVCIAQASGPVNIKLELLTSRAPIEGKTTVERGKTRNAILRIPREFPIGAGELIITGTGGLQFERRCDTIIYDNRHVILVQTSASTYRPHDTIEAYVVVTDENFIPMDSGEVTIEIYDAAFKLVGEFQVVVQSGVTKTIRFQIAEHFNMGEWLVSATMENTTSSVKIFVTRPVTPSFDFKAILPKFLLHTNKELNGSIEIHNDTRNPIVGHYLVAIGQTTEQEEPTEEDNARTEKWHKWKSQKMEIAGRVPLNYNLLSSFEIDITRALAIQVCIEVTDLASGQERVVRHVIPVLTGAIVYDIRPLEFHAGMKNKFEIIARRPDGKPIETENMIVSVSMILGDAQDNRKDKKTIEIKDFNRRGRDDIGSFNVDIPKNCIGVLMRFTPLGEGDKIGGFPSNDIPLMPRPRRRDASGAKLSVELLSSTAAPVNTDVNVPVVSTKISAVGRVSNFDVQLIPTKPLEKIERLPVSYILMTNGRIILSGEFFIEPTRECQSNTAHAIRPEERKPPTCVFQGTLPISMTSDMVPYSTLLVYTFQPPFGFYVAKPYRFSVDGLFKSSLTLNATIVQVEPSETVIEHPRCNEELNIKPVLLSPNVQDRTRVKLTFTGTSGSIVGINVVEYDALLSGLSNNMTKERSLKHVTSYEHESFVTMPSVPRYDMPAPKAHPNKLTEERLKHRIPEMGHRPISKTDEEELIRREQQSFQVRHQVEKIFFGVNSRQSLPQVEGDDIYTTSNMGRFYGEEMRHPPSSHDHHRLEKSLNQYDVSVGEHMKVIVASMPKKPMQERHLGEESHKHHIFGTLSWYKKMHSKLNKISEEAFIFMQSGLTIITDFDALRIPADMEGENLAELFIRFPEQPVSFVEGKSLSARDEARLLLEDYIARSDLTMMPPPIMLEEQSRVGYHRSLFFKTSKIEASGTCTFDLPRTKPYTTWVATGFALNTHSGLSFAHPVHLPSTRGLYVLGCTPRHVHIGENVLLTLGVNNYLGKDLSNVVLRIRASNDFDLMEETRPERVVSIKDKNFTLTIPTLPSLGVETRNFTWVPKRSGLLQIIIEVESEFGGDHEVLTVYVRESGIKRKQITARLFDLTSGKKTSGPMVKIINDSPAPYEVHVAVSGTGLDRFVQKHTMETSALVGIDCAIACLYRSLDLRRYLKKISQTESPLFNMTNYNIRCAYQKLQSFSVYDGSYSMFSNKSTHRSSLYLTSLAFGAMISPEMHLRDDATLNLTLTWILSHQQENGSFNDYSPCFHHPFCATKFCCESLTAIVVLALTHDEPSESMPECVRDRLFDSEKRPIRRAYDYLESRVTDDELHLLIRTLMEVAIIQHREVSPELKKTILAGISKKNLTAVREDGSRYIKITDDKKKFHDQLLFNAMALSIYGCNKDWRKVSDIVRWIVNQIEIHPHYDTVLVAVFSTQAWLKTDCLFREEFGTEKLDITVDVSSDSGQKHEFTINSTNMDVTQNLRFTSPVRRITYSVSGFGIATVVICEKFIETEQKVTESMPFKLTQEFELMSCMTEIKAKTYVTYKLPSKDFSLAGKKFNHTMVVKIKLPSGMRINERQLGFFLSHVPEVMYFTYSPPNHKLYIYINVSKTVSGISICLEWCLERLSTVMKSASMEVCVYDYLEQERQLVRLFPIELKPPVPEYSFTNQEIVRRINVEQLMYRGPGS